MANTPSLPISFNLSEFMFPPIKGSGSHFQSPVCSIFPAGVCILRPLGSNIEWVSVTNSILKGSKLIVLLSSTIFK